MGETTPSLRRTESSTREALKTPDIKGFSASL